MPTKNERHFPVATHRFQDSPPRSFADVVREVDALLGRAAWAKDTSAPLNRAGTEIEPEIDHSEVPLDG